MSDPKNNVLKVRISDKLKESLEAEAKGQGVSLSEIIREKLGFIPQRESYIDDNREMIKMFGLTEEEFYSQIHDYLLYGEIESVEGRLVLKPKGRLNTEEFEEACREKGIEAQKRLDEQTEWVRRIKNVG